MIYILHANISALKHKDLLAQYLPTCAAFFQAKIKRYRRWEDAQASLLGRLLLRKGMQQINKKISLKDLKYTPYNKPYFEGANLDFNISHSGNQVVCALREGASIGIDIELEKALNLEHFKFQMTNNEWKNIVNSSNKQQAFYHYWTQKEAVIKAHGKGLSLPLKSFEIKDQQTTIQSENFYLKAIDLAPRYSCHLASNAPIRNYSLKEVPFF